MLALGVLVLIIGGTDVPLTGNSVGIHDSGALAVQQTGEQLVRSDTGPDLRPVSRSAGSPDSADSLPPVRFSLTAPLDTPKVRRRHAIEVSDWYGRRLTIHRYVAFATIPVFALQWAAGDQLYKKSAAAPTWAKTMHRVGATSLAGMFTVNTVTGAWNWWDSRSTAQGRVLRTLHAVSILGADAAFTYAGAKLSNEAEMSADKRRQHRTVALSAMGVTVVSGLAMKLFNK
jgi:hypothetical protein